MTSFTTATVRWDLADDPHGKAKRHHARQPRRGGGGNGRPKLTPDQVRAIRKDPRPPRLIASDYGITTNYAMKVQQGETHQQIR